MPFFTINSKKHIFPTPGQDGSVVESIFPALTPHLPKSFQINEQKPEDFDTFLVGRTLAKRWRVGQIINKGTDSNATVHEGRDLLTNVSVAIKTESHQAPNRSLYSEIEIYKRIHMSSGDDTESGFPVLVDYGDDLGYSFMVMKLLGQSLESVVKDGDITDDSEVDRDPEYITNTVLIATCQVLKILQNLHSYGYVHGNVNARNVMMETDEDKKNDLYLVDLKQCKTWRNHEAGCHQRATKCSETVSRRSDMKDLCKMLVTLLPREEKKKKSRCCLFRTKVVKQNSMKNERIETEDEVQEMINALDNRFIAEVKQFWNYCLNLGDEELPDYDSLRGILHIMYWNINSALLPAEVLKNPTTADAEMSSPRSTFMSRRRESVQRMGETVLSRFVQVDINP